MPTPKLSKEIIVAAIEGFESQKKRIDAQIAELRQMLTGDTAEPPAPAGRQGRRQMSAAARKRIGVLSVRGGQSPKRPQSALRRHP